MRLRTVRIRQGRSGYAVALVALASMGLAATACRSDDPAPATAFPRVASASPSATTPAGAYAPEIDPAGFVAAIDNPYFPLEPGMVFHLRGETEDGIETEAITVTDRTKVVIGVATTVVKDVVKIDGEVAESTFDWYAQDRAGNVWYFGENTAEYENGKVTSRGGSWEAGVDGALPGIIMSADPQVTDSYRQEYYKGEAEDMFWVVETGLSVETPAGRFDDVIRILEWTPLERRIVGEKLLAPGVGLISEHALAGGTENVELLSVDHR